MSGHLPSREVPRPPWTCCVLLLTAIPLGALPFAGMPMKAQSPANAPAAVPANAAGKDSSPVVSAKQARAAEDAYLAGAKHVSHQELEAAERDFARALELNPGRAEYAQAVAVTRQQRVTALVEQSARARLDGENIRAQQLLLQARQLDPGSPIVAQHLGPQQSGPAAGATPKARTQPVDLFSVPADRVGGLLAGPLHLAPSKSVHSFHQRAPAQDLLRQIYAAYGLKANFDSSFTANSSLRVDVDDVDFAGAARIVHRLTHSFAVPLDATSVLIARDSVEDRDRLEPQIEETIYLPGMTGEQMTELANVARQVFDLKKVTASPASGGILVSGNEPTLRVLNATYDNMLDGGSDVLLEVRIYEVAKSHDRNVGLSLPQSAGAFSITAEATSLVNQNSSLIQQAVASGVLTLGSNATQNLLLEVAFLLKAGVLSSSQYTNLLGTFGGGLTWAGLYVSGGATFNLLLNATDTRLLDAVTLRAGDRQPASFRAGSRYPVITGSYSSGVSNSLASQLAGLNTNGTSVSSLLSQYLGSTTTTIPQFQYEDLGLTLKTTPIIDHAGSVSLQLDMKLEALGGTSLNNIPILNNRTMTSTVNVPVGQTALLATMISRSEARSIAGLPGLSELPGFQGTDKDADISDDELLITITPHVVRAATLRIAARPLSLPHAAGSGATAEP